MSTKREERKIVIIGGGIVGVSAAYFLTRNRHYDPALHSVLLLEASGIASGSSGKAGGFIASWATPRCIAPLSFRLHESLAEQYGGDKLWGFRRVHAAELKLERRAASPSVTGIATPDCPRALDWLYPGIVKEYEEIGTPLDSAQVHPYLLTTALARFAQEGNVKIIFGAATSINYRADRSAVESVTYTDTGGKNSGITVDATDVLVASGPWSPSLLPAVQLLAPKCHSIVIRPSRDLSAYILFPTILSSSVQAPDVYPRPRDSQNDFETVYSSGPDYYDDRPLPSPGSDVIVEDEKCEEVLAAVRSVTSLDVCGGEPMIRQACYKAQIMKHEEGVEMGPMVGPMDASGLWLATGLDEWGIQNGPAVGLLISEMILEGKAQSADVGELDPKHWI